ncbi:hypothetical protein [Spirosoma spitsbergense]|uniref:hypothetical protein n=1 Tax=Spirosoma spitsbergense TaxID=431554 RepID=UPI00037B9A92|nr:hypothetical protein [Spirosoma spitsbergense]
MVRHYWWLPVLTVLVIGYSGCQNDAFLDSSIPRVVTPPEQIATVRTKWYNGKLQQTTFLDKQDRVLEDFLFGRTNEKIWNVYAGKKKVSSTHYYHNDSSTPGYINIIRRRFEYNVQERVVRVLKEDADMGKSGSENTPKSSVYTYRYIGKNDTLVSHLPTPEPNRSTVIDSIRWERNQQGQLIRHYRLYVMKMPQNSRLDTIRYFSHRFAYDHLGRRTLAWYDLMYLGWFYIANGPDTIRYEYGRGNRPVREIHRYTTDIRNKREIDTISLDRVWRRSLRDYRQRFLDTSRGFYNGNRTDTVEYRYEPFEAGKHLPLHVSQDIGY